MHFFPSLLQFPVKNYWPTKICLYFSLCYIITKSWNQSFYQLVLLIFISIHHQPLIRSRVGLFFIIFIFLLMSNQIKSNQITFIVTSPQHKCLGDFFFFYIWTVHIYRLYRRQCAKYTYIYSVHIVYYKDILNYQLHIIHRMGTSTLCTLSIHYVVYT